MEKLQSFKKKFNIASIFVFGFAAYGMCVMCGMWFVFFLIPILLMFGIMITLQILNSVKKLENNRNIFTGFVIALSCVYLMLFPSIHSDFHFYNDVFKGNVIYFPYIFRDVTVLLSQSLMFIFALSEIVLDFVIYNKKKNSENAVENEEFNSYLGANSKKENKIFTFIAMGGTALAFVFTEIYFFPGINCILFAIPYIALLALLFLNIKVKSKRDMKICTVLIGLLWVFLVVFLINLILDYFGGYCFSMGIEVPLWCFLGASILTIPCVLVTDFITIKTFKAFKKSITC